MTKTMTVSLKLRSVIYAGIFSGGWYIHSHKFFVETFVGRLLPVLIVVAAGVLILFDKEYMKSLPNPISKRAYAMILIVVTAVFIFLEIWRYYR